MSWGERLFLLGMLLGMGVIGYLVARWRYRRLMVEMHEVHELCEDAAYRAGLERGRKEPAYALTPNEIGWYQRGLLDGEARGRKAERRTVDRFLSELGIGKQ